MTRELYIHKMARTLLSNKANKMTFAQAVAQAEKMYALHHSGK